MRKKFLAGLLSFAMVFSPMPTTAVFAENDGEHTLQMETQVVDQEEPVVEEDTQAEADIQMARTGTGVNDGDTINSGGTYVLSGEYSKQICIDTDQQVNIILASDVKVINPKGAFLELKNRSSNVSIDGKKHTMSIMDGCSSCFLNTYGGTLTVSNITMDGGYIANTLLGKIIWNSGTLNGSSYLFRNSGCDLEINGGSFCIKDEGSQGIVGGRVNITGGEIEVQNDYAVIDAMVTMSGGTIKNSKWGIEAIRGLTISGDAKFENNARGDIYLSSYGTFTVKSDFKNTASVALSESRYPTGNEHVQITTDGTDESMASHFTCVDESYGIGWEDGHLYIYLKHSHEWKYSAADNKITAVCSQTEKPCSYHTNGLTATLFASDQVYTGNAYDGASLENNITDVTGEQAGAITYAGRDGTNYEESTTAPTNAGKYTAKVTIGGATAKADFEITRASQTATVSMSGYDFGSTPCTPSVSGQKETPTITYYYYEDGKSDSDRKPWENITGETLEPGTYHIYAVLSETANYTEYKTEETTFDVKGVSMSSDIKAADVTKTYDGNRYGIEVTGNLPAGAKIRYGENEDNYTSESSPNYKNAGTYTVYYEVTARGYSSLKGSATVTIHKKNITAVVTADHKTYDGSTEAAVTATVEDKDLIAGDSIAIKGITGTFADKNAGTDKRVAIDGSNAEYAGTGVENYNITIPSETTASIEKRTAAFAWGNTRLTYTGNEQSVTAEVSNVISGDTFTLAYDGNKQTKAGNYTAKVTALGNDNYKLPSAEEAQVNWTIAYFAGGKVTVSGTKGDHDWYVSAVALLPESGYEISTDGKEWKDALVYDTQGSNTAIYYLKETATGFVSDKNMKEFKIDTELPTGEIKIKDNGFTQLLHAITFKFFFKKTVDVKITGNDATSGIAKIAYQKVAKNATFDPDGAWTEENAFSITANDSSVIYARITDNAGHSVVINSDGIVVYTDATETATETFTKTSEEDITTAITVNGNTIASMKNGDEVVPESAYEIKEDKLVLKASYLQTLAAGTYTLTVSYHPYGEVYTEDSKGEKPETSVITLTVKNAKGSISDISDSSKIYDGNPVEAPTFTTTNDRGTGDANVTVEYKKQGADDSTYTSEAPKNSGEYVVRITVKADENYDDATGSAVVKIVPKTVSLAWSNTEFTYDGTAHVPTAKVKDSDLAGSDQVEVKVEGEQTNAGRDYTAKAVALSNSNYVLGEEVSTTFAIKPATVTVTIDHAAKHIGKEDPAFTYQVTGIVAGESLKGITMTRTAGETAGEYEITAAETAGSNPNYNVTFVAGKLTISDHVKSETPVEENRVEATCTKDGSYEEVFYCTVDGCKEKLECVQKTIPATGHAYGEPEFTWSKDYSTATAIFTCANDKTHVENITCKVTNETTDATCETAGKAVYTAITEFEGKTYTDSREQVIEATGHAYGKPEFTWSEDHSTATAVFTCANNASHVETVACEVTSEKTEPTCTEDGKIVYTATCSLTGETKSYTDTVEECIKATGHAYGEPEFTWSKDYSTATAKFTCANDKTHVENITCKVTSETTDATSESDGKTVYTAMAEFNGKTYQDTKISVIKKTQQSDDSEIQWQLLNRAKEITEKTLAEFKADKETKASDIADLVAQELKDNHIYSVISAVTTFQKTEPTEKAEGKIGGIVTLSIGNYSAEVSFDYALAKTEQTNTTQKTEKIAGSGAQTSNGQVKISWNAMSEADGYQIYVSLCNGKNSYKMLKDTKTLNGTIKNLDNTKSYKFYVVAYKNVDGKKVRISKSMVYHVTLADGKYTNVKEIKVPKSSYTLDIGEKKKLTAKSVKEDKTKKLLEHAQEFRYYSSDASIAVVSKNGEIKAKKPGSCIIYIVANNGVVKKVKVTVS